MKISVLAVALAAPTLCLCATAGPASAQTWWNPMTYLTPETLNRAYVEVDGGAAFQGRTTVNVAATGLGTSYASAKTRHGAFGDALVGFRLAPGIAIEAEGVYARNHYTFGDDPILGSHGATRTYGGLGNVKLFIPYTPRFYGVTVTPFVAGGIGFGSVDYDGLAETNSYHNNESGFMYQGKAGLEFKVRDHLAFDLAYRYLAAPGYETPGAFNGANYSGTVHSHVQAATFGVKYNF